MTRWTPAELEQIRAVKAANRAAKWRAAPAEPGSTPARRAWPVERCYLVVGPRPVGGKKAGETVCLCLTDDAERSLIEAGHVVPAPQKPAAKADD